MSDEFFEVDDPVSAILEPVTQREEQQDRDEQARELLQSRMYAYRRVFDGASPFDLAVVLEDLRRFCRGNETTFDPDARVHALLTGRQETFLRIEDYRTLSLDQLVEKYQNGKRP